MSYTPTALTARVRFEEDGFVVRASWSRVCSLLALATAGVAFGATAALEEVRSLVQVFAALGLGLAVQAALGFVRIRIDDERLYCLPSRWLPRRPWSVALEDVADFTLTVLEPLGVCKVQIVLRDGQRLPLPLPLWDLGVYVKRVLDPAPSDPAPWSAASRLVGHLRALHQDAERALEDAASIDVILEPEYDEARPPA